MSQALTENRTALQVLKFQRLYLQNQTKEIIPWGMVNPTMQGTVDSGVSGKCTAY